MYNVNEVRLKFKKNCLCQHLHGCHTKDAVLTHYCQLCQTDIHQLQMTMAGQHGYLLAVATSVGM